MSAIELVWRIFLLGFISAWVIVAVAVVIGLREKRNGH